MPKGKSNPNYPSTTGKKSGGIVATSAELGLWLERT